VLYFFIILKNDFINNKEVTMITNLQVDINQVISFNKTSEELARDGVITEAVNYDIDDVLIPYSKIFESMEGFKDDLYVQETRNDFDGVYFASESDIRLFCKNYEPSRNYSEFYGVADNVSQILDYIDLIKKEGKENFDNAIIAINFHYKRHQPADGGWRWHKWGRYLGKYRISHEYLYDEDIAMVISWEIINLEPKQENK